MFYNKWWNTRKYINLILLGADLCRILGVPKAKGKNSYRQLGALECQKLKEKTVIDSYRKFFVTVDLIQKF